jgi:hypothetical protein
VIVLLGKIPGCHYNYREILPGVTARKSSAPRLTTYSEIRCEYTFPRKRALAMAARALQRLNSRSAGVDSASGALALNAIC